MEKRLRLTALKKNKKNIYTPYAKEEYTTHTFRGQGVLFFVSDITKLEINGHLSIHFPNNSDNAEMID